MKAQASVGRLPFATKMSYGIGGFGKDFGLVVVNTFLFFYYTDVVGIKAEIVGLIFLVARFWDVIADIFIAYLISKTKTRWGKYKPWILVGNALNAVATVSLFSAHYFSGDALLAYITLTYIIWGTTYTLSDAPFWSLLPTITLDKKERESVMPWPRIFASAANYIASAVAMGTVHLFGGSNDRLGFLLLAVFCGVLGTISATITCRWVTRNYKEDDMEDGTPFSLSMACKIIVKNNQLLWLLAIAIFFIISTNITQAINIYYFTYVIGAQSLFSVFMIVGGCFGLASIVFFSKTVDLFGRRAIFITSLLCPVASCFLLYAASLLSSGWAVNAIILLSGVFMGLANALYWLMIFIMVADTIDYGDARMGLRAEAVSYSAHSLMIKLGAAITGYLVGTMLHAIHYVPKAVQTPETISGFHLIYVAPSLLCLVSLFIYCRFYTLNDEKIISIQLTLEEKYRDIRSDGSASALSDNIIAGGPARENAVRL
ncbi:melibiose:sodium symporter [Mixta theicola]|uniref:Melibiose:sodium symporter n=1 Tax=Mixta theicola TaxID=1458355 RepID=A0A2K1Q4J2_9GAMM|nr:MULTISPECIES: glycoside-pentoside-hexuronide (GPH):cation symporter [Enterobacterales]ELB6488164.1 MFS transporter [Raoultella ornithinolytica]MCQ0603126.1 glycoside-pentoside-hexuronide (GPH):cation symporter [Klebsiella pneumoniae]PNS09944.1 melibiose:sodium symporter [Mixta theicola]GLR08792.1 melibiose/sodium symporter [Mixta theicola]